MAKEKVTLVNKTERTYNGIRKGEQVTVSEFESLDLLANGFEYVKSFEKEEAPAESAPKKAEKAPKE